MNALKLSVILLSLISTTVLMGMVSTADRSLMRALSDDSIENLTQSIHDVYRPNSGLSVNSVIEQCGACLYGGLCGAIAGPFTSIVVHHKVMQRPYTGEMFDYECAVGALAGALVYRQYKREQAMAQDLQTSTRQKDGVRAMLKHRIGKLD